MSGLFCIFISIYCLKPINAWWTLFVRDVGLSLTMAGLLGLIIDLSYRKHLFRDAFEASIGYILPEELKGEMEWIYESNIICTKSNYNCTLEKIDDNLCFLFVACQRTLLNVSKRPEKIEPKLEIDEWLYKKEGLQSEIISFGYKKGDKNWSMDKVTKPIKDRRSLTIISKKIDLNPNEEIVVCFEFRETKRQNDSHYQIFSYPTIDPIVTTAAFDVIDIEVGFGYRKFVEKIDNNVYRLKGTLLPYQILVIRWWNKKDHTEWLNNPN